MRDTELHAQILGVKAPWFVDKVDLKVSENSVDIWLDHGPGERWPCSECGKLLPCRDHAGGTSLAPSGYVSVQDVTSCSSSASGMPGTWSSLGACALG